MRGKGALICVRWWTSVDGSDPDATTLGISSLDEEEMKQPLRAVLYALAMKLHPLSGRAGMVDAVGAAGAVGAVGAAGAERKSHRKS